LFEAYAEIWQMKNVKIQVIKPAGFLLPSAAAQHICVFLLNMTKKSFGKFKHIFIIFAVCLVTKIEPCWH